jgi:hypothetical protein
MGQNGREMYLARYSFVLDALLGSKRTTPIQNRSLSSVPNTPKLSETEGPLLTDETVRFTGIQARPKTSNGFRYSVETDSTSKGSVWHDLARNWKSRVCILVVNIVLGVNRLEVLFSDAAPHFNVDKVH